MAAVKPGKVAVEGLYSEWEKQGRPVLEVFSRRIKRPASTVRRWLLQYAKDHGVAQPPRTEPKACGVLDRQIKKAKTYVVTSAQNATPVHKGFFAALRRYCEHHRAELVIIPLRYRNPTSVWSANDTADDWWAPEVVPYLCESRHLLNSNLALLADIKIQPTADNPLVGFESVSRGESAILGHPKVALSVVPMPSHATPKILATTGSVTKANYTNTKAGKKGEFHHAHAAVVVELDGGTFHLRHLSAVQSGAFIDLDTEYTPTSVGPAKPALAVVMGDTHAVFADPSVLQATFGAKGLVASLSPKNIVWHDVLDFYAANHHHRGEPFLNLAKYDSGMNVVEKEVRQTFALVDRAMSRFPGAKHVFPHSNHDAALLRWLKEADWRSDPANARFYLETALYVATNTRMSRNGASVPDPFEFWGKRLLSAPGRCRFLSADEAFVIAGVDLGGHGHMGANGARGSLKGAARLGVKSIIGHSHTPGICEGAMQVGTSSQLRLGYNKGASSWLHTHAVLYANGKRTLVNFIDGEYTLRSKNK